MDTANGIIKNIRMMSVMRRVVNRPSSHTEESDLSRNRIGTIRKNLNEAIHGQMAQKRNSARKTNYERDASTLPKRPKTPTGLLE